MMNDLLKNVPRWFVLAILLVTMPMAGYAVSQHLAIDQQQSTDIQTLASTVANLAAVVEYNLVAADKFRDSAKKNHDQVRMDITQVQIDIAKLEEKLR